MRVEQGLPRRLDDVLADTPIVVQVRSPSVESISTRVTAPVPLPRVEDAHLVVGEVHAVERRVARRRCAVAQRGVERVHRAVALGGRRCTRSPPTRTLTVASVVNVAAAGEARR